VFPSRSLREREGGKESIRWDDLLWSYGHGYGIHFPNRPPFYSWSAGARWELVRVLVVVGDWVFWGGLLL